VREVCEIQNSKFGVADWRDEFVRGGYAATHKFILGLSNAQNSKKLILHFEV
jgi:hypothetical protein